MPMQTTSSNVLQMRSQFQGSPGSRQSAIHQTHLLQPHLLDSVSGDASYRPHVFRMAQFLENELKSVGCDVRAVPLGKQVLNGQEIDLPPALLASIGNDPSKKTILCYGHFDVQPVCLLSSSNDLVTSKTYSRVTGIKKRWVGHGTIHTCH